MKSSQFPFGQYEANLKENRKILIKKRVYYKNEKEHKLLQEKINILKNIYHKNAINFRQVEDNNDGTMDVYYNYVPYSLESFFTECSGEVIKEIHRQLIKLVIHMAKNCLLTSFNPRRCGVLLNADDKWQLKYYLPLKEIIVTNDVTMLERSVQLFTVQSLHFLDSMTHYTDAKENLIQRNSRNPDLKFRSSFQSLRNGRRDSQPFNKSIRKQRRFSNQAPFLQFSKRKLSIMSRQKSEISSESLKQTNSSTMFQTIRSSSPGDSDAKKCDSTMLTTIKSKPIATVVQRAKQANSRSRRILKVFNQIIRSMRMVKQVCQVMEKIELIGSQMNNQRNTQQINQ